MRMWESMDRPESGRHGRQSSAGGGGVLSVFDFDGTLTRHDSFLPFLWFAFGTLGFVRRLPAMLLPSLAFLLRRISRDELKARLLAVFSEVSTRNGLPSVRKTTAGSSGATCCGRKGCAAWPQNWRPGPEVTLCSASPALVLRPFAERLGVGLIGTELEVIDGRITGRIAGGNCRAENKVLRLQAKYGPLTAYRLRAWGDTQGDHALLRAAQDPHWRAFHPRWRRKFGAARPVA